MIGNLFKRDIHRNIEGVVKADNLSDEAVFQEVDEYVITQELNKKFDEFFAVYSDSIGKPTESIGVWISGFFGSGKSHLLKILSYILSSRRLESELIGELFLSKIDQDDFELIKNIKRALSIKTDTILFNIDQKTDIGTKAQDDAILSVFMKVFNEMRGYYPKQGYIADFEKKLDRDGLYKGFKESFASVSGNSWEIGREQFEWEIDNIAKALSEIRSISYESAQQQLSKLDSNYVLSVESFVEEVNLYIKDQDPNYRLIFMVDEVGQYIGDNTRLMLNLQTIVETMATKCKGQAWVIVTSQSAVKDLVDTNKLAETDFSKILGRFKVKLNLTSQNANEVIQKRLLDKKEEYRPELSTLYSKHHNSLASIIYFSERGRQYKNYKDSEDFVLTYPFIPYQLDLFQSCIVGLSKNEVFQGRHQSVGERSMLDVIQNVAQSISDKNVGTIASFDYFYDGIANIIRPESERLMTTAKNQLDPFSLKVLKILFMVKYVQEFNPTHDHITTLLVDELEVNVTNLKENVKKSLSRLINETFIQKVGENYEFLTDKEKEIENEIKGVSIDEPSLNKELADWIYDNVIVISKFRYQPNKQDYAFTRKMDGVRVKGTEAELSLNVLTPLGDEYDDEKLVHKSFADSDLILALRGNFDFEREMRLYLQTKKYIPQKQGGNISATERQILIQKAEDNNIRKRNLTDALKGLFEDSVMYFNGSKIEAGSSDPKTMIENAFNQIITTVYPYLSMLRLEYKESDIKPILMASDDLLSGSGDALNAAESEMLNRIRRLNSDYQNISVNKLLEIFSIKPYGWHQSAIMCLIASLFAKKTIDITEHTTYLDRMGVNDALTNNRRFATTIIKPTVDGGEGMDEAKKILGDLFPSQAFTSTSVRDIWQDAMTQMRQIVQELEGYKGLGYPFAQSFEEPITVLKKLDVPMEQFVQNVCNLEDELLDMKEDHLDRILEFMRGEKRKIYDRISEFVKVNQTNLYHLQTQKTNDLIDLLKDTKPFAGNKIQLANASLKEIQDELEASLQRLRTDSVAKIDATISNLQNEKGFLEIPDVDRNKVIRPLQMIQETLRNSKDISFINERTSSDSLSKLFAEGLDRIEELLPDTGTDPMPTIKRVNISRLRPENISKIETEADVENYLSALKTKLLSEIKEGNQIIV